MASKQPPSFHGGKSLFNKKKVVTKVPQKTKKKSGLKMARQSVNSNDLDDVSSNKSSMVSVEDDREDEDVDDGGNAPILYCK